MRIKHRLTFTSSRNLRERARLLLDLPEAGSVTIEVHEDDMLWPQIRQLVADIECVDIVSTRFTSQEESSTPWVEMLGEWHHGYPQPDKDFGYLKASYDLTRYCAECGIGARQASPLRLVGEPVWGQRSALQLHWLYGEFFFTPEAFAEVFEAAGVTVRVVTDIDGVSLTTVVQLDSGPPVPVDVDGVASTHCPACDRLKYTPVTTGPGPAPLHVPQDTSIFRSEQWFGTGANAFRLVYVPQTLRNSAIDVGLKGVSFIPAGGPTATHEVETLEIDEAKESDEAREVDEIIDRLVAPGWPARRRLKGCTNAEIERLRLDQGLSRLPPGYRRFLERAGRGASKYLMGSDAFYPEVLGLKLDAEILFDDNGIAPPFGPDSLVIMMHQGYQVFWIASVHDERRPVLGFSEGEPTWKESFSSLAEFFRPPA